MPPPCRNATSSESASRRSTPGAHDQAVDQHLDRVPRRCARARCRRPGRAASPSTRTRTKPPRRSSSSSFSMLALPVAHDRRVDEAAACPPAARSAGRRPAAPSAPRSRGRTGQQNGWPDAREEQAQVVGDLGDGADGRARVPPDALLLDRDRRRQALDARRSRASPSARGTAARRPTATRRSAAGPRRRACRRRATTCPSPRAR